MLLTESSHLVEGRKITPNRSISTGRGLFVRINSPFLASEKHFFHSPLSCYLLLIFDNSCCPPLDVKLLYSEENPGKGDKTQEKGTG